MNLTLVELLVAVAYLAPVALVVGLSARRETALWDVALQIPVAVAADLFVTLLLTRVFPLEVSAFVVRGLWVAAAVVVVARRRRRSADRSAWPRALPAWTVVAAVAAGVIAVVPFLPLSRSFNIWDRDWHSPLTSSLQAQTLPFHNVYDPTVVFHYHFSGDVVAAVLRAYSFDVLSSSRGLGLAHDLFLGLTAAWLTLVARGVGTRRLWACALGAATIVWHGPWPRQFQPEFDGYAYHLFAQLSYRPHVPLSLFGMTTFVGALTLQAAPGLRVPPLRSLGALVASVSILSISDETSVGILGLSLGLTWLFIPQILGFSRARGVLALLAIGAALVVPNALFSASLSRGGPAQSAAFDWPPRFPSILGTSTPLFSEEGHFLLFIAIGPVVACWLALAASAVAARSRGVGRLVLFGAVVTVVSMGLATTLTVNHAVQEGQRFFEAPFAATLVPVIALVGALRPTAFTRGLLLLGLGIPSVYTLYFNRYETTTLHASGYESGPSNAVFPDDLFEVDCRRVAGAHLGERARPIYVDAAGYYLYTTCRPVFTPGGVPPQWPVKIYAHVTPVEQLREIGPLGGDTEAICRTDSKRDALCARVAAVPARCTVEGTAFLRCPVSPEDRAAVLGTP